MADTTSDSLNCGKCGHDCLGGSCKSSVCQPVHLVKARAGWLELDETRIFMLVNFGANIEVRTKANPQTAALSYPVVSMGPGVTQFALDGDAIYWPAYGGTSHVLMRGPKAGGTSMPVATFAAGLLPRSVVISGTMAYLLVGDMASSNAGVYSTSINGGQGPTKLLQNGVSENALAQDDTFLAWTNYYGNKVGALIKKTPAATQTIAAGAGNNGARGIAMDGKNTYFTVADEGAVKKVVANLNAAIVTLASNEPVPHAIQVDGGRVYFGTMGSGTLSQQTHAGAIKVVSSDGGQVSTLATGQTRPMRIATDATAIYWVNLGADDQADTAAGLWRLAK